MEPTLITSLTDMFVSLLGEIPTELEPLFYIICVIVLLFVLKSFFDLLWVIFGVFKWKH